MFYIPSQIIPNVVYVGPLIRFIRNTYLFIKDHLWSCQNHPVKKLVLIAKLVVLLTRMAKLCCLIRTPCGANEPPPNEASLCLDTYFPPGIRRLQQLVVLLRQKMVQLHHKSHFVIQLDGFRTQNTGWSLINETVVLDKRIAKTSCLILTTQ